MENVGEDTRITHAHKNEEKRKMKGVIFVQLGNQLTLSGPGAVNHNFVSSEGDNYLQLSRVEQSVSVETNSHLFAIIFECTVTTWCTGRGTSNIRCETLSTCRSICMFPFQRGAGGAISCGVRGERRIGKTIADILDGNWQGNRQAFAPSLSRLDRSWPALTIKLFSRWWKIFADTSIAMIPFVILTWQSYTERDGRMKMLRRIHRQYWGAVRWNVDTSSMVIFFLVRRVTFIIAVINWWIIVVVIATTVASMASKYYWSEKEQNDRCGQGNDEDNARPRCSRSVMRRWSHDGIADRVTTLLLCSIDTICWERTSDIFKVSRKVSSCFNCRVREGAFLRCSPFT